MIPLSFISTLVSIFVLNLNGSKQAILIFETRFIRPQLKQVIYFNIQFISEYCFTALFYFLFRQLKIYFSTPLITFDSIIPPPSHFFIYQFLY
jgi:hypothetical protein